MRSEPGASPLIAEAGILLSPSPMGKRVLIVDDEVHIVDVVREALEDYLPEPGVEPLVAYNGRDALVLAQSAPPDLVITDIMMPYIDGLELCRQLRSIPATAGATVLVMSARHNVDLDGCDAACVISKPFDLFDLVDTVATLLSQPSRSTP